MLHWKDADNQEAPGMRVTYHHNYFDKVTRRSPQFSYGLAEFFNNYLFQWYEFAPKGRQALRRAAIRAGPCRASAGRT